MRLNLLPKHQTKFSRGSFRRLNFFETIFRLDGSIGCRISRHVSGHALSRHVSGHALSCVSSRLSSHVSCHVPHIHRHASGDVFGHVFCHVCRSNSGHVSRHDFYLNLLHVSRRASRHDSVTSPVLPFVVCLMSLATTLPAFRVSSRVRDLKMCPRPAKAIQPTQKGSLCDLNMRTAPQRDR